MIWLKEPNLEELNSRPKNHIGGLLDIKFTEIGKDFLKGTMPVDDRTRQPYGILHGGASVVLTETLGSVASNLVIDTNFKMGVGLEVNANHLRPIKSGLVTGICTPIHIGGKTHVWDIKLYNDKGKITCISRLTIAVVPVIKL
jgi:1,4-dihydroxy-2-naphthoyl-CoA hydrolase